MSATKTQTLTARLEDLRQRVREAEARLRDAEAERTRSARKLDEARGPLLAYWEAVAAGEREADDDEEARLIAQVREVEAVVTLKPMPSLRGGTTELVAHDERAEALVNGARRAVERANAELEEFARRNAEGLFAERAADAQAARDELEALLPGVLEADRRYREVRARWRWLCELLRLPADLPRYPLRGAFDDLDNVEPLPLPIPASVLGRLDR